jgi:hypothetical protein
MDVADLYGLPLDQFVVQRTALARELRSAGDRDQAAQVTALRKPSVAAWAVNQLVRTQREAVDVLVRAGDGLRDAQSDVLSGRGGGRALRAAGEEVRDAVSGLVNTAKGLLSSGGLELSPATLERVSDTLNAAALDDEARGLVMAGSLERELRHVGLGDGTGFVAAPERPSRPAATRTPAKTSNREAERQRDAAREREAAEREAATVREAALKQARADEREARREVERTERALRAASDRRDRAAQALDEAQDALERARAEAAAATEAHRAALERVDGRDVG